LEVLHPTQSTKEDIVRRLYYGLLQTVSITYLVMFAYVWHRPEVITMISR
jgi:hypothetical protein